MKKSVSIVLVIALIVAFLSIIAYFLSENDSTSSSSSSKVYQNEQTTGPTEKSLKKASNKKIIKTPEIEQHVIIPEIEENLLTEKSSVTYGLGDGIPVDPTQPTDFIQKIPKKIEIDDVNEGCLDDEIPTDEPDVIQGFEIYI